MLKIGITGQEGFLGKHLYNHLGLNPDLFERINFERTFFQNQTRLDNFVKQCDVIVHLAAMNRHDDPNVIYNTNVELVESLLRSLKRTKSIAHVIFSSSSQEGNNSLYGASKLKGREMLTKWANESGGKFTGLIIPNVFGPFGKPFYNSVVATFAHQIVIGESPKIVKDAELRLIYVQELVKVIIEQIIAPNYDANHLVEHTALVKVSEILEILNGFKNDYLKKGTIPKLNDNFELNLFNTFRSYIDLETFFPVKYMAHQDERGSFVEIIRLNGGGQVSFSTTQPGVTRGNHFHTRKIERFSVIKGKALIKLRKIGSNEVLSFELSGDKPSYIDMPIWYSHNIKNIGDDVLYTNFWINEFYNAEDTDTYFDEV